VPYDRDACVPFLYGFTRDKAWPELYMCTVIFSIFGRQYYSQKGDFHAENIRGGRRRTEKGVFLKCSQSMRPPAGIFEV